MTKKKWNEVRPIIHATILAIYDKKKRYLHISHDSFETRSSQLLIDTRVHSLYSVNILEESNTNQRWLPKKVKQRRKVKKKAKITTEARHIHFYLRSEKKTKTTKPEYKMHIIQMRSLKLTKKKTHFFPRMVMFTMVLATQQKIVLQDTFKSADKPSQSNKSLEIEETKKRDTTNFATEEASVTATHLYFSMCICM